MSKDIPITVEEMQADEIMNLRKQVEQLEGKTQTVSKEKYDSLLTAFEQMRTNFIAKTQELEDMHNTYDTMQKMYIQASDQVTEQTEQSTQTVIIKELKAKLSRPAAGAKRKTDKTDADIIAMRENGLTIRKIRSIVRRSPTTIVNILKNTNVT